MLESYRDLIEELLGTPRALRVLLAERGDHDEELARLVAGIRDRDRAVLDRLQLMLRERDPMLPVLVEGTPAVPASSKLLLDEVDMARGDLVSLLMSLALKDWERTATHEIDGEISLAEEVERHVDFDEARLAAIEARCQPA